MIILLGIILWSFILFISFNNNERKKKNVQSDNLSDSNKPLTPGQSSPLDVEDSSLLSFAIKTKLKGPIWHKGAYNRPFPCMQATYP